MDESASRTSSSLKGLMMAVTSFMWEVPFSLARWKTDPGA
jgi:hypothetical protein